VSYDDVPVALSLECLQDVANPTLPLDVREDAFARMLTCKPGWWGDCLLLVFAQAVALCAAREHLGRDNADQLDWEDAADVALLALFDEANAIEGEPRDWLCDTIRGVVGRRLAPPFDRADEDDGRSSRR
jgi:hypothetical protein